MRKTTSAAPKKTGTSMNVVAPLIRFEMPGTSSAHGVSGYPTTGIVGDYNYAFNRSTPYPTPVGPSASRYNVEGYSGVTRNNFNEAMNAGYYSSRPRPDPSNFTGERSEATNLSTFESGGSGVSAATRPMHHNLQSGTPLQGSYARMRQRDGFGQHDPVVTALFTDSGLEPNRPPTSTPVTPQAPPGINYVTPIIEVRTGNRNDQGTHNLPNLMTPVGPSTGSDYATLSHHNTPGMSNTAFTTPATHPTMSGPGIMSGLSNVTSADPFSQRTPSWIYPYASQTPQPAPPLATSADLPIRPTGGTGRLGSSAPQQQPYEGGAARRVQFSL